jgi:DNA-binding response OmpR family regulator
MTNPTFSILVADDERNIRKTLAMILEAAGYRVDAAADGEEALDKCKEQFYDIALVDIQMPKLDGLALLQKIRALKPKTAVVIMTAYGSVARAVEAMKLGAVDFLEKPFEPKIILLLCEEILQRQKIASGGSVDDLLHLAALARERGALLEERAYLKTAMLRDVARAEPCYQLALGAEADGDSRQAVQYYFMAHDADPTYEPAEAALIRLGKLKGKELK